MVDLNPIDDILGLETKNEIYGVKLTSGNIKYVKRALEKEKQYGLPAGSLVRLINHESRWNPTIVNPKSGATGLGQFLPDTSRELGIDPTNWEQSIDGAARYLRKNIDYFNGDTLKGFVSYFKGAGNVEKASRMGGENWLAALDQLTGDLGGGTASEWLGMIGMGGENLLPGRSPSMGSTASPEGSGSTFTGGPPSLADPKYRITNPDGSITYDSTSYYQDYSLYLQNKQLEQSIQQGGDSSIADYISAIVGEIGLQIEAGQLDVSKANSILDTRLNSFKTAMDVLSSNAYGYGSPVSAAYQSGRGPGDYATTQLGLPTLANQGSVVDPLQEALKVQQQSQNMMGAIQPPNVPNLASMLAGRLPPGTEVPGAPPAPPPLVLDPQNMNYRELARNLASRLPFMG